MGNSGLRGVTVSLELAIRLIDMGSMTVNDLGDLVGTSIVAHSERSEIPVQEMSE